jgi:hypothetical protein
LVTDVLLEKMRLEEAAQGSKIFGVKGRDNDNDRV